MLLADSGVPILNCVSIYSEMNRNMEAYSEDDVH